MFMIFWVISLALSIIILSIVWRLNWMHEHKKQKSVNNELTVGDVGIVLVGMVGGLLWMIILAVPVINISVSIFALANMPTGYTKTTIKELLGIKKMNQIGGE